MTKLYAGVDGGGTKTLAVITDESGRELGRGEAGPSNWVAVGLEVAVQNIANALAEAMANAAGNPFGGGRAGGDSGSGAPDSGRSGGMVRPDAVCFGLAGAGRPADATRLHSALAHLAPHVLVTHDAAIALAGALGGAEGAILIAGTGAIAYGENADGRTARAGGWGWLLDDLGGGFDVGRRTLHAILRARDGRGPATALAPLVLDHWDLSDPEELISRVYRPQVERADAGRPQIDRAEIAALSQLTAEAARGGDPVALAIWQGAGRDLAETAAAVLTRLGLEAAPVATVGSLWKAGELLRAPFQDRLAALKPGARVVAPLEGPAEGAALLARTRSGTTA